jgi:riboflavin synthase
MYPPKPFPLPLVGDPLGGHLVSGHVDGVGEVLRRKGGVVAFKAPPQLARYLARKGSVTIDGVSLTINQVDGSQFEVNLIPHTLQVTTLSRLEPGTKVNLEIDPIARYVERLLNEGYKRVPPTKG